MWTWILTGAAAIVIGIGGTAFGLHKGITPEAWAAWAQAYFSVIAIAAAIVVAQWQRREDRLREFEREKSLAYCKMDMVVSLAEQAIAASFDNRGWVSDWAWECEFARRYVSADVLRIITMLESLGPSDVTDGEALAEVLKLRGEISELDTKLQATVNLAALLPTHPGAVALVQGLGKCRKSILSLTNGLTKKRDLWRSAL